MSEKFFTPNECCKEHIKKTFIKKIGKMSDMELIELAHTGLISGWSQFCCYDTYLVAQTDMALSIVALEKLIEKHAQPEL